MTLFQVQQRTLLRTIVRIADTAAVVKTQVVLPQTTLRLDTVAPVVIETVRHGAVARILADAGDQDRTRQQQYDGRRSDSRQSAIHIFQHPFPHNKQV